MPYISTYLLAKEYPPDFDKNQKKKSFYKLQSGEGVPTVSKETGGRFPDVAKRGTGY